MEPKRPNFFILESKDIEITYAVTSISGKPLLTYQYKGKTMSFLGEDIRQADTEIGQLVTVEIGYEPDRAKITLTILIPRINLEGNETPFQTEAIITEHLTSIGGPALVKGALQVYRNEPLAGKAKFTVS